MGRTPAPSRFRPPSKASAIRVEDQRDGRGGGRAGAIQVAASGRHPARNSRCDRQWRCVYARGVLALGNQLRDAAECRRLGVFDEIADPEEVLPRSLEIAAELAAYSPETYARTKRDLRAETLNTLRTAAAQDPFADGVGWLEDAAYRERARSALGVGSDARGVADPGCERSASRPFVGPQSSRAARHGFAVGQRRHRPRRAHGCIRDDAQANGGPPLGDRRPTSASGSRRGWTTSPSANESARRCWAGARPSG